MLDEKKQYPRSKLEITEAAKEPRTFGTGGQVLNFKAKVTGPEGNPWLGQNRTFGCFKPILFDTIKQAEVGATLDCDVETKPFPSQEGERLNYNILQVYVGGQPVATRQQGRYNNDDSPEKRKSIEDQNRAGHITNLWIAGKILEDNGLVGKLKAWLNKIDSPTPEKPASQPVEKEAITPPTESKGPPPLKTQADLRVRGEKFGISARDICNAVGVGSLEQIEDLNEAWKVTATRYAEKIKAAGKAK